MDFLERRYQQLTVSELGEQLANLTEQMWDTMDFLHAIQIGRIALMNEIQRRGKPQQTVQ